MASELTVGEKAPDFEAPSSAGGAATLAGLAGKKIVLYFYPKDDTPGCTIEAMEFEKLRSQFAAKGAEVIGVSPDSLDSHDKFKKKHNLGFDLLSDSKQDMLRAYGVWVEKNMYGKKSMGVERTTVLIGSDGKIARVWNKVKPEGHAQAVLEAVSAL